MKILIVEDEPSLRELMCRELTKEQYVVESAATFAEADAESKNRVSHRAVAIQKVLEQLEQEDA